MSLRTQTQTNKDSLLRVLICLVGAGGFEPPKSETTDLQSAPFGHSGTLPYLIFYQITKSLTDLIREYGAGGRTRPRHFVRVLMAYSTAVSPLLTKNLSPTSFLNVKTLLGFKSLTDLIREYGAGGRT